MYNSKFKPTFIQKEEGEGIFPVKNWAFDEATLASSYSNTKIKKKSQQSEFSFKCHICKIWISAELYTLPYKS